MAKTARRPNMKQRGRVRGRKLRSALAQAWDEGHGHCFHVERPGAALNPYRGRSA